MSFLTSQGTDRNGASNLPSGRFPDQLCHQFGNPLRYSEGASQKVRPLDHIQVIRVDDVEGVPRPYFMTLQFPVSTRLPNQSRLYFFYLAECQSGDTLTFIPTPLSGESVNGNLFGHTFNLFGYKVLFVCIAVNGNWIIHPLQNNIAPPGGLIPMVHFTGTNPLPLYGPAPADNPVGSADIFMGDGGFGAEEVVISGMEGFIVPNQAVPAQTFQGFQCTQDGIYAVDPSFHMDQALIWFTTGSSLGVYRFNLYEFDGAGVCTNNYEAPAWVPFVDFNSTVGGTEFLGKVLTTFYVPMYNGRYYVFSFTWDSGGATTSTGSLNGDVTFQYWAPIPVTFLGGGGGGGGGPPAGPALLAARAAASTSSARIASALKANSDPANLVIPGSAQDTKAHKLKRQQERHASQTVQSTLRAVAASSSSSSSSSNPMFSLNDMENMVRTIIRQQSAASINAPPSALAAAASSPPLASSITPAGPVVPGKKRARVSSEKEAVVEGQPPAKK